jgi:hypothetical protein
MRCNTYRSSIRHQNRALRHDLDVCKFALLVGRFSVKALGICILYKHNTKYQYYMKIGITLTQFGSHATKENIIQLAMMAEQEKFYSLWVAEITLAY